MNNAKVRIYELSKELNLDNKELLAICDQLSIAVKSHSSTITESEAERIRHQAEKLTTTPVMPRKDNGVNSHNKQNTQQPGYSHRPAAPNKQQILEIRKPKPLKTPPYDASEASVAASTELEDNTPTPPKPFAPPVSSMKSPAPIRPVPRNLSESTTEIPVTDKDKTTPTTPNQPAEKIVAEKPEKPPATHKPKSEKTPKPQLAAPPTRPLAEDKSPPKAPPTPKASQASQAPQAGKSERPILKRDRDQAKPKVNKPPAAEPTAGAPPSKPSRAPSQPVKSDKHSKPSAPGATTGDQPRPSKPARSTEAPQKPVHPVATPPKPPISPVKPQVAGSEVEEEEVEVAEIIDFKRPAPPRQVKGKKWQPEEEIDEVKEASKPGKVTKGKRHKPIVDDFEEEDFLDDEDDLDSPEAIQISLSVARPPKPKASKPPQPVSAAIPAKNKKPAATRDQNRRREPDQKRERPEKIQVTGPMTVQELADALIVADTEIVKILFIKGMAVSITQNLDVNTITTVSNELGIEVETTEREAEARKITEMLDVEDLENLQRRPPVVTIMGHVDHGKTTLLDSIRKTKVAAGEAGGITQHIGAYHVDVEHDGKVQQVVFLDTPGHEAFTAMRARGARVTDIAILVVAADDGVRPQTVEAISHAKAAEVPMVIAINKIDKPEAQPDRVKQELTEYGLVPEEWGGETIMVPVSAMNGENLDTLLEMILLVAEVEELSANPDRAAKGTVIEAHLDKAKGPVATLLIQNGTLRVGDILVAGSVLGKVRAMVDDRGSRVEAATPSFAVEVLGLSDVPAAGDEFEVFQQEKEARAIATARAEKQRQSRLMHGGRVTLTSLSAQAQEGELKELNLILKGDVQGSIEAIVGALRQIPQTEVQIRLLLASAGEITQTDIDLAAASGAVIIGFNTTYASGARHAADEAGVDVREYNIIYKLLEDIEGALEGLLEPELVEESLGQAEVRAVFPVGRGAVAGCYIQSGKLLRSCKLRVHRSGKLIYEGILDSLKRMKEDVREVNAGYECGVGVDKFNDWVEGDIIEAYQMVTKRRTLSSQRAHH
jgi:translation initiation factor IF-2